jgi:hypothetical protein
VFQHAFERAILKEPLARRLRTDFVDAGYVVDGIADQREVVDETIRLHAELLFDAGFVERLVRHRVDECHVRAHELRHVLVAGRDDDARAETLRFFRERTDHVVRFHAFHDQQRPAHGADRFVQRVRLEGQLVGHAFAVRLVLGIHVVAEGLSLGVEHHGAIIRGRVLVQLAQHVQHAVNGPRRLSSGGAQVRQRVIRAIKIRRAIDEQQGLHSSSVGS